MLTEGISTKRRNLLRALGAAGIAMFVAPLSYAVGKFLTFQGGIGIKRTATLDADLLSRTTPSKLVDIDGEPVIVVLTHQDTVRAFTATCTHLGCTVNYRADVPGFACKCHGGRFDENGVNVPGTRPTTPLTELVVTRKGRELEITLAPVAKSAT